MIRILQQPSRGAALLAVLCFVTTLAIGITSYIGLCQRSLTLSSRSFEFERAWQLAEVGLEQALWSLNQNDLATGFADADGWQTINSSTKELTLNFDLEGSITAEVIVRVGGVDEIFGSEMINQGGTAEVLFRFGGVPATDGPPRNGTITVTSTISHTNGPIVARRVLDAVAKPLPTFVNAIAGIDSVDFVGASSSLKVDSYNSEDGNYGGSNVGYDGLIAGDSVSIYKADIQGYLAAENQSKISHEPSAKLRGPPPAKAKGKAVNFDQKRLLRYERNANSQPLPSVRSPSLFGASPLTIVGSQTIGAPGAIIPDVYYVDNSLSALGPAPPPFVLHTLTIQGPVQLHVDGSIMWIHTWLNGKIVIKPTGSLELFLENNFQVPIEFVNSSSIDDFIVNESKDPKALVIYSTGTTDSPVMFRLLPNKHFYGTLYFPNSDLLIYPKTNTPNLYSSGDFYGSIIAKTVTLLGDTKIHYDMSLRDAYFRGLKVPYVVDTVEEIIASD